MYSLDDNYKKKNKFTGYIIAAGAILLIGAAFVWGNSSSGTKKSEVAELSDRLAEERQVLRTDVILHDHFRKLQEADEKYNMLITKSPSPAQLDSAGYAITLEERALKNTLDSINSQSTKYNAWANVVMSDSITASFRKALANRSYMASIRSAIEGKPIEIKGSDKELLQMQFDMQKKDEQILALEKEVKQKTTGVAAPQPVVAAVKEAPVKQTELQKHSDELEASLKEEEMRNTGLLDLTKTLKSDNEKLIAELSKIRRNNTGDDASAATTKNKMISLQDQINDLSAELNFAKVDCNLTRADAKKIISNSRQRKELLAQALQSLQDLSKSDNSLVQKKAKDKLSELNQIASTVRD